MTFDEIVSLVASDLNLTADTAITRIGLHTNRRYRRVTTRLGMNVFRRIEIEFACAIDQSLQTVTDIERITAIFNITDPLVRPRALEEISYDEMKQEVPRDDTPTRWAKQRMRASETDFLLNSTVPDALTLLIEGEEIASTLSGDDEPAFNESYHDVLVFGAKADELRKMEKQSLARDMELEYDRVLGELVMHITVGAFQDIVQNKQPTSILGLRRVGWWW